MEILIIFSVLFLFSLAAYKYACRHYVATFVTVESYLQDLKSLVLSVLVKDIHCFIAISFPLGSPPVFNGRFAFMPVTTIHSSWAPSRSRVFIPFQVGIGTFSSLIYSCDAPSIFWVLWSDPNERDMRVRKMRGTASNALAIKILDTHHKSRICTRAKKPWHVAFFLFYLVHKDTFSHCLLQRISLFLVSFQFLGLWTRNLVVWLLPAAVSGAWQSSQHL